MVQNHFKMNSFKNRYAKIFLQGLKETNLRLFQPCPFVGSFNFINVQLPEKTLSILPNGNYISKISFVDVVQKCTITSYTDYTIEK